jgi:hypothetical protein
VKDLKVGVLRMADGVAQADFDAMVERFAEKWPGVNPPIM